MNKIEHPMEPNASPKPKEGQYYYHFLHRTTYLLARVGTNNKFGLVNLQSGDRWSVDPEDSEVDAFVGKFKEFALVTAPFTITPDTK